MASQLLAATTLSPAGLVLKVGCVLILFVTRACVAVSMFLQTLQCYSNLVHWPDNYHNVNWTMDQC